MRKAGAADIHSHSHVKDSDMGSETAAKLQSQATAKDLERYGCGPIRFNGTDDSLYERHLLFDNAVDEASATPRDRFEAFARATRDVLSHRWVLTENTYAQEN